MAQTFYDAFASAKFRVRDFATQAIKNDAVFSSTEYCLRIARHCNRQLKFWTRILETSSIQDATSVSQVMTPGTRQ